ncbi:MAG: bifunctional [glutamate--ammonia ligase]-adenylyl-L-tyrosine [Hyphomicrobiales bacterium]|nr:bifunctional [glutamate--ammonia ligase]-adenylyl-L-tyrosine [Hyphomicrobiales bacterium]
MSKAQSAGALSLAHRLNAAPVVHDERRARERMVERLEGAPQLAALLTSKPVVALLRGLADHSPYLWRLVEADPARLAGLLSQDPDASFTQGLEALRRACESAEDDAQAMVALRAAKQHAHLLIALADIGGVWDVVQVTAALSSFADAAVSCALRYLLRRGSDAGRLKLLDARDPERGCGFVILALGKHGACELNYSSDVDLVAFFDPESPCLPEGAAPGPVFVRLTQALAKLLQERTGDGYALRVDLRLRPDPGSTSVAVSLPAAFEYYETLGQNWERAAFIKARPVAGDLAMGEMFLKDLAPFIWRKYFDYAAIADIHAMKRQIHAVRGHADIAVAGHDVKLGRGGIREIEFFVQTQQLIFGGRRAQLRGSRTLDMLVELQKDGWVTQEAVDDLSASYRTLRTIEHRLQMIADEQTQRLPMDDAELERFALFCGYSSPDRFADALTAVMQRVELHYARLFEHAPGLDSATGSLVFTGVADDPETLETLRRMGFTDPARATETVRGWHFGRRAAVQSARAREVLTELVPALLESFAGSGDPDAALAAFDRAMARMPAAVELFSILKSNTAVRELFGDILGGAPRLAHVVAQRPHVLDAAIDPALLRAQPSEAVYDARANAILERAPTTEAFLDDIRDAATEETFLIGMRLLSGAIDATAAGQAYSALAAALVRACLQHVQTAFRIDHGSVPGGRCAVVGMGKLGSREMTAASDLDLILLYDYDEERPDSDGRRPLHASVYYTRLTQRLLSALTVSTRRGGLYEVDMRLRPSGRQGPVATKLESFRDYQASEAETWEHMALTRARLIAGDEGLGRDIEAVMANVLRRERNETALRRDVREMRALIAKEKGEDDPWDLKLASGGLIDLEFIAQYISLRHGCDHPDVLDVATRNVLVKAGAQGLLTPAQADVLSAAHTLYGAVTQMVRLSVEGPFQPADVGAGVLRRIAAAAASPDFPRVEREIAEKRVEVRAIFDAIMAA